jgi:hypothetical protein
LLYPHCTKKAPPLLRLKKGQKSSVCAAQKIDAFAFDLGYDHVLVTVRLLPATVVECLFFWVFRALAPPLRAVDDEPRIPLGSGLALGEVAGIPLGTNAQIIQCQL